MNPTKVDLNWRTNETSRSFWLKVSILIYNGSDAVVIEMLVIGLGSAIGLGSNDPRHEGR